MPKYILSLDAGTTSSRAILYDKQAKIVAKSQIEFKQFFPKPGWVEHNPMEIWDTQLLAAKECFKEANIPSDEVAAIGITNQRETTILWDRETSEPVHKAIVWQDRRTSSLCEKLKQDGSAEIIRQKTGLVPDAYFSATKIKWILDSDPEIKERAKNGALCFGTVDSWLIWKLTGGKLHITDITNASRTMIYNIFEYRWDEGLLKIFDIPSAILPSVASSSEVYGQTAKALFGHEIPIAGVLGDQQAALFGQLCTDRGSIKTTYGTGSFIVMNTGEKPVFSKNRLLTTIAWQINGSVKYALEGGVFVAGAAVQWLRDQLGLIKNAAEIEDLAKTEDDNGGVYFVPSFNGLGPPYWDQFARGGFLGLTRGANKGHIARATLEAIAFQNYDVIKAMEEDSSLKVSEMRVDGGASANNLLMQFQADILQAKVVRPENIESTTLGVAFAAGLAIGIWKDEDEIKTIIKNDKTFTPSSMTDLEKMITRWHKAVEKVKEWEDKE